MIRCAAATITLAALLGCAAPASRGPELPCLHGCVQSKDRCILAAGNAAELSLCDMKQKRCESECSE